MQRILDTRRSAASSATLRIIWYLNSGIAISKNSTFSQRYCFFIYS